MQKPEEPHSSDSEYPDKTVMGIAKLVVLIAALAAVYAVFDKTGCAVGREERGIRAEVKTVLCRDRDGKFPKSVDTTTSLMQVRREVFNGIAGIEMDDVPLELIDRLANDVAGETCGQ